MKTLSLNEKAEILKHLDEGKCVTFLSKLYGIAKSTVCSIRNKRIQILNAVTQGNTKRTLKPAGLPLMERHLYFWLTNQRAKGIHISGDRLKSKAKLLHSSLRQSGSFCASDGWLQRFKRRYNIRLLKINNEKYPLDVTNQFKEALAENIKKLDITKDQLYKASETGLLWKFLPEKMFSLLNDENIVDRKDEKYKMSLLVCTNSTGHHKLKPLVVGKSIISSSVSKTIEYKRTQSAPITEEIFKNWFHNSFVVQVKKYLKENNLPGKAILLLDNATYHPYDDELKSDDGFIISMHMPPNSVPHYQNVLHLMKLYYRTNLLSSVIGENINNIGVTLKKFKIQDAIKNIGFAWNKLKQSTIRKYWNNILIYIDEMTNELDDIVPGEGWYSQEIDESIESIIGFLNKIQPEMEWSRKEIEIWNDDAAEILELDTFEDLPATIDTDIENNEIIDSEMNDDSEIIDNEIKDNDFIYPLIIVSENKDSDFNDTNDIPEIQDVQDASDIPDVQHVPVHEAIDAFKTAILWAEQNIDCINQRELTALKRCRDKAIKRNLKYIRMPIKTIMEDDDS